MLTLWYGNVFHIADHCNGFHRLLVDSLQKGPVMWIIDISFALAWTAGVWIVDLTVISVTMTCTLRHCNKHFTMMTTQYEYCNMQQQMYRTVLIITCMQARYRQCCRLAWFNRRNNIAKRSHYRVLCAGFGFGKPLPCAHPSIKNSHWPWYNCLICYH